MSKPLSNPPAKASTTAIKAYDKNVRFIDVLKNDHGFDIVKEIIDEIQFVKRAKRIKPQEKRRLLNSYYLTLLSYCVPKQKIVEDNSGSSGGKGVVFKIQIGGPVEPDMRQAGKGTVKKSKTKGVSISIPTQLNADGSYEIDSKDTDPTD
jgi:hypothetical protein